MTGGVIRQIELHPSGKYNEVIFHRSGQRVAVVSGSYLISDGELTLLVENLPQRETRVATVKVGDKVFEITYTVGSSGPYVLSCSQATAQIVLTDASGASRVWMRQPPPRFGLPGYRSHGPGYHQAFPWLPNGNIAEASTPAAAFESGGPLEPEAILAPRARLSGSPPSHGGEQQVGYHEELPGESQYGPSAIPYGHDQPGSCDCAECRAASYGPQPYGPQPYGPASHGPASHGPEPYSPEPYGPEPYGPEPYGPQPYGGDGSYGYDQHGSYPPHGPEYCPPMPPYGPPMPPYGPEMCGCGQPDCRLDCGPSCQGGGGSGGAPRNSWFRAEYLIWSIRGMQLPPLVTTSPNNTPQVQAGVLGQDGTTILFGGGNVLEDNFDGGRLSFGQRFNRHPNWGVSAEYFQIGSESESFSASSEGLPILTRPFFNTQIDQESSELVAFPGVVAGTVASLATSKFLGGGVHARNQRQCNEDCVSGDVQPAARH